MTDSVIIIPDLDLKVTLRQPGYATVRRTFRNWSELNDFLATFPKGNDYPSGTVLTVDDWTGRDRFAVRGGAKYPPGLIKLADLKGLPSLKPDDHSSA